ncbi:TniQ family protein [Coleofasciculus sp. FACHB-129]|uniref:TniQ family protein n=1 Tax=Cyanophyceae TaxID=3028117 RepID=UPI0018F008EA|nr:TniQ family protein [Coleofasciculus sp. FACHB-129]
MAIYSEHWSLKPLEIPQRSRLFSLEPVAVGTPYTESLSSYLNRLAQEHCLTSQKLIMGEIAPLILKDEDKSELLAKNLGSGE